MNRRFFTRLISPVVLVLVGHLIASIGQIAQGATTEIWKASPVSVDCTGPSDTNGRPWYDPDFNDSEWTDVQLPEVNIIPSGQDRYYRLNYNLVVSSTTKIYFSSDDGAWLYVNGQFVGHWGTNCHSGGRADNVSVDITSYLHLGMNVIAMHVSNGPSSSRFDLITPPRIILPMDSQVTVEFISTSTSCTGDFGMYSPHGLQIYNDYLYHQGVSFPFDERFSVGTELVFYLIPKSFCGSPTYLSNDPSRTRIEHPNDFTWRIKWEDYTDADFNDLVVEVRIGGAVFPFLELPFDYIESYSTFIRAASDNERGGTVNSYFDHKYPTYDSDPNSTYPGIVTFHGYDSGGADRPGFNLYSKRLRFGLFLSEPSIFSLNIFEKNLSNVG
jgi:hypothetical protein